MSASVLWDSSAILAVLDQTDTFHAAAEPTTQALADARLPGVITNYILAEAHSLLLHRLGREVALRWLLQPGLDLVHVTSEQEDRALAILARYNDKNWSLCDAISFAFMEAHGIRDAFTYDRHFAQWGKCRIRG